MCLTAITARSDTPTTEWEQGWKCFAAVYDDRCLSDPTGIVAHLKFEYFTPVCLLKHHGNIMPGELMRAEQITLRFYAPSLNDHRLFAYASGFHCYREMPAEHNSHFGIWCRVKFRGVAVEGIENDTPVAVAQEMIVLGSTYVRPSEES